MKTYVFDVWAWVDCDDISMLDSEVVSNDSVDTSASVIQIIVGQDDQDSVFPLLSLDKYCVSSE